MNGLETERTVHQIQGDIVTSLGGGVVVEAIPNVSDGFFRWIECDLVVISPYGYLHEFEIKRSWSDFLADFKKAHFHDDVRLMRMTYVVPVSFAGERLKRFCDENWRTFKRSFDFWFYREDGKMERPNMHDDGGVFDSSVYLSKERKAVIDGNDPVRPFRRKVFSEERETLYRLGCIRLWMREWHRQKED